MEHVLQVLRPLSIESPSGQLGRHSLTLPPVEKKSDLKGSTYQDDRRIASKNEAPSASTRRPSPRDTPSAATLRARSMLRDLSASVTVITLYDNQRCQSNTCYRDSGELIGKSWRPLQTANDGWSASPDERSFFCMTERRIKRFKFLGFIAAHVIPANAGYVATSSRAKALEVARSCDPRCMVDCDTGPALALTTRPAPVPTVDANRGQSQQSHDSSTVGPALGVEWRGRVEGRGRVDGTFFRPSHRGATRPPRAGESCAREKHSHDSWSSSKMSQ